MFWPDVIDLKRFYGSIVGQIARTEIQRQLLRIWPDAPGETMLAVGYAAPFLQPYLDQADVLIACMPAGQGVIHWPELRANRSVLVDETELPISTGTVNRLLMIHALENSEQLRKMLEEARRVLTPSGRLLVIVPNRRGGWARSPKSPFAYGHPFTPWAVRKLLTDSKFTPLQTRFALFFPPNSGPFFLRIARTIDAIGGKLFSALGGVILIEAEKQVYAPSGKRQRAIAQPSTAVPALP